MPITLTNIFRYGKNSFRIMDRLKRLEEEGVEEIYVRRGLYISIKRLKKYFMNIQKMDIH